MQGDVVRAPGVGSVLMDQRIKGSPLAQQQVPPRILMEGSSKRDDEAITSPQSPSHADFGSALNSEENVQSRAERCCGHCVRRALSRGAGSLNTASRMP